MATVPPLNDPAAIALDSRTTTTSWMIWNILCERYDKFDSQFLEQPSASSGLSFAMTRAPRKLRFLACSDTPTGGSSRQ